MEALLEEVSYRPLQPYSFPTGSIQSSQTGRHDSGETAAAHPHLASASSRLDRLRLQVSCHRALVALTPNFNRGRQRLLRSMEGFSNTKSRSPNLDPLSPHTLPQMPPSLGSGYSNMHSSVLSTRVPRKGDSQPAKKKEEPVATQAKPGALSVVTVEWL